MSRLAVKKLYLETAPGQTRLGLFGSDNRLLEVWFDAWHRPNLMETVHNVRIERVFASQNRATATLASGVAISIRLRKSDAVLAQTGSILPVTIIAAPRHGKPWQAMLGARVASAGMILLVGLAEGAGNIALSSKIPSQDHAALKARLMAEAAPELPSGFGVILRRGGTKVSDFSVLVTQLLSQWQDQANPLAADQIGCIYDGGGLLVRARRLFGDLTLIDNPAEAATIPGVLDDEILAACQPKTPLSCGGNLWCAQSHALWSIDLDGNGVTDFDRLFAEAAIEIPRQMRLRAMSGPVLVDLPRIAPAKAKKFRRALETALGDDPRQPDFLGMTRGGLLELQVPHGETALQAVMEDQPAQDALAGLRLVMQQPPFKPVKLAVSRAMAVWLEGAGRPALDHLDRPVQLVVWSDDTRNQTAHILG